MTYWACTERHALTLTYVCGGGCVRGCAREEGWLFWAGASKGEKDTQMGDGGTYGRIGEFTFFIWTSDGSHTCGCACKKVRVRVRGHWEWRKLCICLFDTHTHTHTTFRGTHLTVYKRVLYQIYTCVFFLVIL